MRFSESYIRRHCHDCLSGAPGRNSAAASAARGQGAAAAEKSAFQPEEKDRRPGRRPHRRSDRTRCLCLHPLGPGDHPGCLPGAGADVFHSHQFPRADRAGEPGAAPRDRGEPGGGRGGDGDRLRPAQPGRFDTARSLALGDGSAPGDAGAGEPEALRR